MLRHFPIILLTLVLPHLTFAQEVLPLYPAGAIPNSIPGPNTEFTTLTDTGIPLLHKVSVPTIVAYNVANSTQNHSAVIICPGGGYGALANVHEGSDVAKLLNSWGISAFVLHYRLPDTAIMKNKSIGPLQDAQRALQMVREHAAEWHIDPAKIGIMGFSAGGHLAATASSHYKDPTIKNPKHISLRPDFSILIYPVISFTDSLTHKWSRENLLGAQPSAESIRYYSNELQVRADTPPAFLVHALDDPDVVALNTTSYHKALLQHKVSSEIILYPHGGHGFGMNNTTTTEKWTDDLKAWMIAHKWL